jgi:N-terminal domain on NACHT_NTPase and P-loop NTPases
MVLEVFTAIGLAASIVQFVDYGTRLFSKSKEIYHSATGASSENVDLQIICTTLGELSEDLASASPTYLSLSPSYSKDEKALVTLAHECNKAASELLSILDKLQNRKGHTKFTSFRQALLVMWNENRIAEISKKMNRFRDQVALCLTKIMLYGRLFVFPSHIVPDSQNIVIDSLVFYLCCRTSQMPISGWSPGRLTR